MLDGAFAAVGMAAFDDLLSKADVVLIHQYVRARAREDRLVELGEKETPRLTWIENP